MKGQSSMEFLALVSMSMLMVAVLYGFMASKQAETSQYRNGREAMRVAEDVGFEVETAMVHGPGYSRVFSVPDEIGGEPYNVTLREGFVTVAYLDRDRNRETLYTGDKISISTNETNTFRVLSNSTGIYIQEQ